MTAATLPHPPTGQRWSPGDQILFLQEIAARLFEDGNWWGAFRVMSRIVHMSKAIPDDRNPLTAMAAEFIATEQRAAFKRRRGRPADAGPPPENPPEAADHTDPRPATTMTPEEAHAHFHGILADINERRANVGAPPVSFDDALAQYRACGNDEFADAVLEIEAERHPHPPPDG